MTSDPICPLTNQPSCPMGPFLIAILDELEAIHQTLQSEVTKAKNPPKATANRPHVNGLVVALQLKFPDKVWTADEFAQKIGCTGAAVRKTVAWREYRSRLENEQKKHPQRKGYKNKKGGFDAYDSNTPDEKDDF